MTTTLVAMLSVSETCTHEERNEGRGRLLVGGSGRVRAFPPAAVQYSDSLMLHVITPFRVENRPKARTTANPPRKSVSAILAVISHCQS
jgi:hypothetical protein